MHVHIHARKSEICLEAYPMSQSTEKHACEAITRFLHSLNAASDDLPLAGRSQSNLGFVAVPQRASRASLDARNGRKSEAEVDPGARGFEDSSFVVRSSSFDQLIATFRDPRRAATLITSASMRTASSRAAIVSRRAIPAL